MNIRIAGLVTSMGEPLTPLAVSSLVPWVDDIVAVVDTKAPPGFAESLGVEWHPYRWADDFSHMYNFASGLLEGRCDFAVFLDADEQLYDGRNLRGVIDAAVAQGADAVDIPTRHFHDMGRTRECQNGAWHPDRHPRIRRPGLRMEGRVHQALAGSPRMIISTMVVVEHYNLATRTEDDWRRINAFYDRLGAAPGPAPA